MAILFLQFFGFAALEFLGNNILIKTVEKEKGQQIRYLIAQLDNNIRVAAREIPDDQSFPLHDCNFYQTQWICHTSFPLSGNLPTSAHDSDIFNHFKFEKKMHENTTTQWILHNYALLHFPSTQPNLKRNPAFIHPEGIEPKHLQNANSFHGTSQNICERRRTKTQ